MPPSWASCSPSGQLAEGGSVLWGLHRRPLQPCIGVRGVNCMGIAAALHAAPAPPATQVCGAERARRLAGAVGGAAQQPPPPGPRRAGPRGGRVARRRGGPRTGSARPVWAQPAGGGRRPRGPPVCQRGAALAGAVPVAGRGLDAVHGRRGWQRRQCSRLMRSWTPRALVLVLRCAPCMALAPLLNFPRRCLIQLLIYLRIFFVCASCFSFPVPARKWLSRRPPCTGGGRQREERPQGDVEPDSHCGPSQGHFRRR